MGRQREAQKQMHFAIKNSGLRTLTICGSNRGGNRRNAVLLTGKIADVTCWACRKIIKNRGIR